MDNYDLDKVFSAHTLELYEQEDVSTIREKAKDLAAFMGTACQPSRELSLARTNLEQAVMWANAAIARSE